MSVLINYPKLKSSWEGWERVRESRVDERRRAAPAGRRIREEVQPDVVRIVRYADRFIQSARRWTIWKKIEDW